MSDNSLRKARAAAYRMLALKDRTEKYIRDALEKKAFSPDIIADVMVQLREDGYVNDLLYAQKYIASRVEGKPYGPYWLQAALIRAGIPKELAKESIADVFTSEKEVELASIFLSQLLVKNVLDSHKALRKLVSRGFSTHAAKHVIFSMNIPAPNNTFTDC